jgi:AcrR family transcriptional regulator
LTARTPKTRGASSREDILRAAAHHFALCGYAGASVQTIVDEARVTKPALYYHFPSKEALYLGLVDHAHEERFRLMQKAAARGRTVAERLVEIAASLFDFAQRNQELTRLMLAAAFAAPREVPASVQKVCQGHRHFEFIQQLIAEGQATGELSRAFTAEQLAFAIYGQMNIAVISNLLHPDCQLDRAKAGQLVALFLDGARAGVRTVRRKV